MSASEPVPKHAVLIVNARSRKGRAQFRRAVALLRGAVLLRRQSKSETMVDFHGRKLRLVTDPPLPISIDGEVLGRTPALVEVARGAIEVVVPA